MIDPSAENKRLDEAAERAVDWKLWGPYVSDRAWGTVREDYSPDGSAWDYFPFEHAHLRAYRWNDDGIAGICDRDQTFCFALALWNEKDAILKERLFGLPGPVGNHAEDVKEYYYYLDSTPTHSYMKFLYKYPQAAFPYEQLYRENAARGKSSREYELIDTGVFDSDAYFDVFVEYAKSGPTDISIRITAINRGTETAPLHILPTVWFRNTWSWANEPVQGRLSLTEGDRGQSILIQKGLQCNYNLFFDDSPDLLFCSNESNNQELFGSPNASAYTKDGIGKYVVNGSKTAIDPQLAGSKAALRYRFDVAPGGTETIHLRLGEGLSPAPTSVADANAAVFDLRIREADEFYSGVIPANLSADGRLIMRQAFAGMLWSKQFYHYVVKQWLEGDPAFPAPPDQRLTGRNTGWKHLHNEEVISMPDKWEYPWFAAWDLAFHCVPLALVDPSFAKRQLILLLREWYMHPNGQIPAYEWAFDDVNPPVHAWAALRVYQIEKKQKGVGDRAFLARVFHKLLLNFTWWVNRKDAEGNNVFEGGFLGLDNIGIFDRSKPLPGGGFLEQSDGTSWMAMYCLNLLAMALELAQTDQAYEDVASKFFEHFVFISDAMNNLGNKQTELWDDRDGFYYDVLHMNGDQIPIKIRSLVGLIPLFAVETIEEEWLDKLPNFRRRSDWLIENRKDLVDDISCMQQPGRRGRHLLSLVNANRLRRVLETMLDEKEFLSDHGIRSLSRYHKECPYFLELGNTEYKVAYDPAESTSGMFGGNSNWRGPIWFPVNYLLIEALQKYDHYYGNDFQIEFPTGSGKLMNLWEVAQQIEKRLSALYLRDQSGSRAAFGDSEILQSRDQWRDNLLFFEYFDGDTGRGLGANHQTGWTGLIAKILKQTAEYSEGGR
ncbi:MAG: glucosidase [Pyrinomonadaceae bacterium]